MLVQRPREKTHFNCGRDIEISNIFSQEPQEYDSNTENVLLRLQNDLLLKFACDFQKHYLNSTRLYIQQITKQSGTRCEIPYLKTSIFITYIDLDSFKYSINF